MNEQKRLASVCAAGDICGRSNINYDYFLSLQQRTRSKEREERGRERERGEKETERRNCPRMREDVSFFSPCIFPHCSCCWPIPLLGECNSFFFPRAILSWPHFFIKKSVALYKSTQKRAQKGPPT